MKCFITGGAGFIGSNVADRLLFDGHEVRVYDNLTTGNRRFLSTAEKNKNFSFVQGDLLDKDLLKSSMEGMDIVFHFAANADIRHGLEHPYKDLEQNTLATFNVLEAMRSLEIKRIVFSSTGAVYGEAEVIPTPENAPFPIQTSLYGASKVACEGMIASYAEGYGFMAHIFRFVSILGDRYTHGHVFDFCKKLRKDPSTLPVLGDGTQKKSYLCIDDCVNAILCALDKVDDKINIFNLGVDNYCQVSDSAKWVSDEMGLEPEIVYSGGRQGWVGDNPFTYLATEKIRSLGWKSQYSIEESVRKTVRWLMDNEWVFDVRE
ncbi:MAG: NAD-dependent epimerase/dehydratase family protein [Lachnospiraceae bacterium]|nr:NAD-dependent epimerase/dehydratase family protein [Lachnospiraceae bacterium]